MKTRMLVCSLLAATYIGLGQTTPFVQSSCSFGSINDRSWKIRQGNHFDGSDPLTFDARKKCTDDPDGRTLSFDTKFDAGWNYNVGGNQSDWNKFNTVFFTFLNPEDHLNDPCGVGIDRRSGYKMHLGWRWSTARQKMELALFYHESSYQSLYSWIDNKDFFWRAHYIGDAKVNSQDNHVNMFLSRKCLAMIVNGRALGIHRGTNYYWGERESAFNRLAWFGGGATAPNDILLTSKDMLHDFDFNFFWSVAPIQQWNLTRFSNGDTYEFVSMSQLIGSEFPKNPVTNQVPVNNCKWHPEKEKGNYCLIEAGADIKFYAGEEVSLRPGFHAQRGSKFHAKISGSSESIKMTSSDIKASTSSKDYNLIPDSEDSLGNDQGALNNTSLVDMKDGIKLYPNPSQGEIFIKNDYPYKVLIKFYDTRGTILQELTIEKETTLHLNLKFPRGLYYCKTFHNTTQFIESSSFVIE